MRKYRFNDVEYPSVTTILDILDKPALVNWAAKMAAQYVKENYKPNCDIVVLADLAAAHFRTASKEACDIGTEVHEAIEDHIKGVSFSFSVTPEVEKAMEAFFKWEKENVEEWLEVETPVFNAFHGYAGRLDAIVALKKYGVTAIDFKTSKALYDEYIMQIAAYAEARNKLASTHEFTDGDGVDHKQTYKPIEIKSQGILRLDKLTGLPEYHDVTKKSLRALQSFIACTDLYYSLKKRRLANNCRVK